MHRSCGPEVFIQESTWAHMMYSLGTRTLRIRAGSPYSHEDTQYSGAQFSARALFSSDLVRMAQIVVASKFAFCNTNALRRRVQFL